MTYWIVWVFRSRYGGDAKPGYRRENLAQVSRCGESCPGINGHLDNSATNTGWQFVR